MDEGESPCDNSNWYTTASGLVLVPRTIVHLPVLAYELFPAPTYTDNNLKVVGVCDFGSW